MTPIITLLEHGPEAVSPRSGGGFNLPILWALEEAGRPYEVRLRTYSTWDGPRHMGRLAPFRRLPCYEEGALVLCDPGAIVLRIAEGRPGLLPTDEVGKSRALEWMFFALARLDSLLQEWAWVRNVGSRAQQAEHLQGSLYLYAEDLGEWVYGRQWLERDFSVGDLMVVSVLQRMKALGIDCDSPTLQPYIARAEARPAYQKAAAMPGFTAQVCI